MQRRIILTALTAALSLTACGAPHGSGTVLPSLAERHVRDVTGGMTDFSMSLYDAPLNGPGLQVNLALTEVDAVAADGSTAAVTTYPNEQVVNLLALRNTPLTIAGQIPANNYTAIRLNVDPVHSNLTIFGHSFPLTFVSPQNGSTIAINVPLQFTSQAGSATLATADFNVLESVTLAQGGGATIAPKVVAATDAAAVSGVVVNSGGQPVANAAVQAIGAGGNVANTTTTNADGSFQLRALGAGNYQIVVQNAYTSAAGNQVQAQNADANAAPTIPVTLGPSNQLNLGQIAD